MGNYSAILSGYGVINFNVNIFMILQYLERLGRSFISSCIYWHRASLIQSSSKSFNYSFIYVSNDSFTYSFIDISNDSFTHSVFVLWERMKLIISIPYDGNHSMTEAFSPDQRWRIVEWAAASEERSQCSAWSSSSSAQRMKRIPEEIDGEGLSWMTSPSSACKHRPKPDSLSEYMKSQKNLRFPSDALFQ